MSRRIDMTQPETWTEDDIAYLAARGKLPKGFAPSEAAQATGEDGEEFEDYDEGWTNDERKESLARRGLSTEGKKAELIARLVQADEDGILDPEAEDESE